MWPAPPLRHALIPSSLLNRPQLPECSYSGQYELCRHLFEQLEHNTEHLVYSFSDAEDTGVGLSPLLGQHILSDARQSPPAWSPAALEFIADQRAPPMTDIEKQNIGGGVGLVEGTLLLLLLILILLLLLCYYYCPRI